MNEKKPSTIHTISIVYAADGTVLRTAVSAPLTAVAELRALLRALRLVEDAVLAQMERVTSSATEPLAE